jgi:hypothetical protein
VVSPAALALAAVGCRVDPGNDPNVPDDELPFAGIPAEAAVASVPCSATLPQSCASIPSYAMQIEPILARSCVPMCHAPGGTSSDRDLSTYAKVSGLGISVLTPVSACVMPPLDAGPDAQLTPTERQELVQWIGCGSPDN